MMAANGMHCSHRVLQIGQHSGRMVSVTSPRAFCNRELLDNGGFIYMPAVKVRARGKAAAGLSAGVKAGMMGAAIGKSPAHFGR